jgi:hypothetical protein
MGFTTATFRIVSKNGENLSLDYVLTYGIGDSWGDAWPDTCNNNPGIQNVNVRNASFNGEVNCIVTMDINPEYVNQVPYASDKASLLFSINGSNLHIDIHKSGGMKVTDVYGSDPKAISWNASLKSIAVVNTIYVSSN